MNELVLNGTLEYHVRRSHLLQSRLSAAVVEGGVSRERSRWSAISAAEPMKSRPPSMRDG
jgi:hypothetical protein